MKMHLNYSEIMEKVNNETYKTKKPYPSDGKKNENFVFDENQSVKWNREQVKLHNDNIDSLKEEYSSDQRRLENEFCEDVIEMIMGVFDFRRGQAEKIYNKAYEDGHSYGMYNILQKADDYADFVYDVIKA